MGHTDDEGTSVLDDFARRHGGRCPEGEDRFDWSTAALDDLARLVAEVAPASEQVSGRPSDVIEQRAQDLVTAIVAHRNSLLCEGQEPDRRSA